MRSYGRRTKCTSRSDGEAAAAIAPEAGDVVK